MERSKIYLMPIRKVLNLYYKVQYFNFIEQGFLTCLCQDTFQSLVNPTDAFSENVFKHKKDRAIYWS
jgi:hypothetical protein